MKRGIIFIIMLLPMIVVLGNSNSEIVIEKEMDFSSVIETDWTLDAMMESPQRTKFKVASRSYSRRPSYRKPTKSYINLNWLTWNSNNSMFVSLLVGASSFQHERIFKDIPGAHVIGLKVNPALGVAFGYRLNPIWTFRLKYMNTKCFYAMPPSGTPKVTKTGTFSMNSFSLNAGFDIVRMVLPTYLGKHRVSPYLGIGALIPNDYVKSPLTTAVGLGYIFNATDRVSINVDAEIQMLYGINNVNKNYPAPFNLLGSIMAGVSYRF